MNTTTSTPDNETRAVEGREELATARQQLLAATRYKLAIYLPALPPDVLSSPAELAELRRIATSGRGAEIRVILGDPATALRTGHRMIDLVQRLPTAFQVRTPTEEDSSEARNGSAWLLNDGHGYLFLPDADRLQGRIALRDGPGQAPLLLQFEQMWDRATPATQLQPLGL
jgi:hypothetical protein